MTLHIYLYYIFPLYGVSVTFNESRGPRTVLNFFLFIDVLTMPYNPVFYILKVFLNVLYWLFLSVVQSSKQCTCKVKNLSANLPAIGLEKQSSALNTYIFCIHYSPLVYTLRRYVFLIVTVVIFCICVRTQWTLFVYFGKLSTHKIRFDNEGLFVCFVDCASRHKCVKKNQLDTQLSSWLEWNNPTRTRVSRPERIISTNYCIHTVVPSDDGSKYARNI